MADLKEQLLKAGLITEEQSKRVAHEKRVDGKKLGREERETRVRKARAEAEREKTARAEADRQRERERRKELEHKTLEQQERQRGEANWETALREGQLTHWEGPKKYYFSDGGRIECLSVTEETRGRLETGGAAIVRLRDGRYTLLHAGAARKLAVAVPSRLVTFHEG